MPASRVVVRGDEVPDEAAVGTASDRAELTDTLEAELVLDATGRGSRLSGRLEGMGFLPAPEERVRIDLGYTRCVYRRRPDHAGGYNGLIAAVALPKPRSGVVFAQEGDRWIVTLVGYLGDAPEPTYEGMREFARGVPSPEIFKLPATPSRKFAGRWKKLGPFRRLVRP